jgi:alanyl-tRNA synthetase
MSNNLNLDQIEVQVDAIEKSLASSEGRLDAIANQVSSGKTSTTAWPVSRVRSTFINYFVERRQHTFWNSSPVVPVNDPTLLFANSGMNQFKPLFLGTCDPNLEMYSLKRACNSQKCIRAGGKHNDLEDVGKDVYHHTFFEMLGNWSFGCYFKEEAITWAWECLTEVFGLDPNRLYATYFGGDPKQGLAVDEEARKIWLRFLPSERILPYGCKDNFWEMGPTGPCGPCTEIHYDRIGGRDAGALVNADRPDVIEIWNNVFIQFNREADGSLKELPSKHVDTGMGLERLSSILQGKDSNYDTDIFMPIFEAIQHACGCRPYQGLVGASDTELIDMAYRVVADHIRTLTFAITDGAVPGSDGRGYVLRRILRRAVRYGQEMLGAPGGFFASLVSVVVANFSDAFPELITRQEFVRQIIADEEQSFIRTLDQGCKHFKKLVTTIQSSGSTVVPGKEAHFLFCSMGFPLDLTELMAAERGLTVDTAKFAELLENDRKISETAESMRKGMGSKDLSMEAEQTAWLQSNQIAATDSTAKYAWHASPECKVVAVFKGRGGATAGFFEAAFPEDDLIGIILDSTPFYPEAGGQTFDTGELLYNGTSVFTVENVQTYAGYLVHVGRLLSGPISVGTTVTAKVDYQRRSLIAPNHTMTHVLNYALRRVLLDSAGGDNNAVAGQCEQKGSLVDAEKLRFDFSWNGALSSSQIAEIQDIVVQRIHDNAPVYAEAVSLSSATQIHALRKVFGEKYPDPVRVISVGVPISDLCADPENPQWRNSSIEFCGGTHLSNTGDAEDFVLVEESGIAKGVRRIVGLTRHAAAAARAKAALLLDRLSAMEQMPGGAELSMLSKSIKIEVDQAVVSLVDKEKMRAKQSVIADKLKQWNKANLTHRTNAATSAAETLANAANSNGEV